MFRLLCFSCKKERKAKRSDEEVEISVRSSLEWCPWQKTCGPTMKRCLEALVQEVVECYIIINFVLFEIVSLVYLILIIS